MKELKVTELTKTYGEKTLFDQISFHILEKDRIGLIGTNGTGKTSLLNILAGKSSGDGDRSTVHFPVNYQIGYLSQESILALDLTIVEALFQGDSPIIQAVKNYELALLALDNDATNKVVQKQYALAEEQMNQMDAWDAATQAKIILQKLGIHQLNQKISTLSGGQQKRVSLAQILIESPDLLLLDEPTNHLDYEAIQWLETYLASYPGAVLMVTHDRYFLDRVSTQIYELAFGKLYQYKGNYQTYLLAKAERQQIEQIQEEKRQQLYKQELAWIQAGVKARGTKQQARKERFHDLKENLYQVNKSEQIMIDIATQRLGKKVLTIEKGQVKLAEKLLINNLNLLVQTKDRIGITGENGAGKTTLLNVLAGRQPLSDGTYMIGETVKIAYYTQINEQIDPEKRIITYLQEVAEAGKQKNGQFIGIAELLERFLFPRAMHGTKIGKLSGGEKKRLFLLQLLLSQPNVLLLDEPTNDLDIDTLTVLEEYIHEFQGAVIAVSHDRYFLDKIATKLLIFQGNAKIIDYFGTMSDYLAKTKNVKKIQKQTLVEKTTKVPSEKKEKIKLTYIEQKEWETIEEEITQLEDQCRNLTEEMNHQGANFTRLNELQKQLTETEQQLEEKIARWEYLSDYV